MRPGDGPSGKVGSHLHPIIVPEARVSLGRILELDGLRGIAIALVLLFHMALLVPPIGPVTYAVMISGWCGVDLFFVLSGFLIGGILIDQRQSKTFFGPFYARRVFRILPPYLAIVTIYFAVYLAGGPVRHALVSTVHDPMPWWAYLTFTNNFWIASHSIYHFLGVSWSLAVEEQFYLTLPLIVRFTPRRALPWTIFAITVVVLATRASACYAGVITQDQAYALPFFRIDSLMIGVGCALLVRSPRWREVLERRPWWLYGAMGVLAVAMVKLGMRLPDPGKLPRTGLMMFGLTLIALFFACLLLLAVVVKPKPLSRTLTWKPLRALGDVSYFVYLSHEAIMIALVTAVPKPHGEWSVALRWLMAVVAIAVSFVVARVSWRLLEAPMIRIGHRFRYERKTVVVPEEPELEAAA